MTDFNYFDEKNIRKMKISNALKDCLMRKPLSKVTIGEIADKCKINRNTFYYYFTDITDLVQWTIKKEIVDVLNELSSYRDIEVIIDFLFEYYQINRDLLINAFQSFDRFEGLRKYYASEHYAFFHSYLKKQFCNSENSRNDIDLSNYALFITEIIISTLLQFIFCCGDRSKQEYLYYLKRSVNGIINMI